MKKKILFVAVATALALAFVLPSFGVMNAQCRDDNDCSEGMTCVNYVCQGVGQK